jgi:hypothetical protein
MMPSSKLLKTQSANDDFREIRKTKKGLVESGDIKIKFNLPEGDQVINHITCNQT